MKQALKYDDIQIIPAYSEVKHRSDCLIGFARVSKRYSIKAPIVSAPMDSVTEWEMAHQMWELGGLGFIHRFMSMEDQVEQVRKAKEWEESFGRIPISGIDHMSQDKIAKMVGISTVMGPNILIGAAIGVTDDFLERAKMLVDAGVRVLLLDVAHGHHILVYEALSKLKEMTYVEIF